MVLLLNENVRTFECQFRVLFILKTANNVSYLITFLLIAWEMKLALACPMSHLFISCKFLEGTSRCLVLVYLLLINNKKCLLGLYNLTHLN